MSTGLGVISPPVSISNDDEVDNPEGLDRNTKRRDAHFHSVRQILVWAGILSPRDNDSVVAQVTNGQRQGSTGQSGSSETVADSSSTARFQLDLERGKAPLHPLIRYGNMIELVGKVTSFILLVIAFSILVFLLAELYPILSKLKHLSKMMP